MESGGNISLGLQPKKRVASTYGKTTARRRPKSSTLISLGRSESAPTFRSAVKSRSPSPEPRAPVRQGNSSKNKENNARSIYDPPSSQPEQSLSQPAAASSIDVRKDGDVAAKKRKLVRIQSDRAPRTERTERADRTEKVAKPIVPYSTPDSSPMGSRSNVDVYDIGQTSTPKREKVVASRTTPEKDVAMGDAGSQSMPFSVKTARALENLSVGPKISGKGKQEIPIRLSGPNTHKKQPSAPPPVRPAIRAPAPAPPTAPPASQSAISHAQPSRKRRRLIDALADQADESTSEEELQSPLIAEAPHSPTSSSQPTEPALQKPRPFARPAMTGKKSGPKFTYSQQRSMLAEEDPFLSDLGGFGGLGDSSGTASLFGLGHRLNKSATVNLDEDDETGNAGAVLGIHELRQAGANSRFADEMDDIFDRIGAPSASAKPSPLRRGALLELAQKVKEKEFRQQFRNYSGDGNLFKSLGEETDLVSGYCILTIITTLLATSASAHLIQMLRSQGLSVLLARQLARTTDIVQLSRDRKENISKNGQNTLGTIKASLLKLPVWEPVAPTSLSPRTLALKTIDLLTRQANQDFVESEVLPSSVTDLLFAVLSDGTSEFASWEFPSQQESYDFYLTLYVLEVYSIYAVQSHLRSAWTKQYAPIVAGVMATALPRSIEKLGDIENLLLRISLNITNHNGEASRLFVEDGLLLLVADAAGRAFDLVLHSVKTDAFLSKALESLIMMLGVMINFCVYYPPASRTLGEANGSSASTLERLIRVFSENHSKTADANSMEETQLNVALGYLSVLLGYLCLDDSIMDQFIQLHPKKTHRPLLDSINEFIAFHRKVAEAQAEDGSKQDSELGALSRLETLVDQLTAQRRF